MNQVKIKGLLPLRLLYFLVLLQSCAGNDKVNPIDRHALVTRNNIHLTAVDTLGALSVGNGEFAFTVDVSGLQTFYKEYENGIPLGTQSQWGWHSAPTEESYALSDVAKIYPSCNSKSVPYAVQQDEGRAADATNWLRANPHRLHLGLVGLTLIKQDGQTVSLSDLDQIDQTLDLWTGRITSRYEVEGSPVEVELYAHPEIDAIVASITSPLIKMGRLKVSLRFPYAKVCHVCPGYDWDHPDSHQCSILSSTGETTILEHVLDSTKYFIAVSSNSGQLIEVEKHHFDLVPAPDAAPFTFGVHFYEGQAQSDMPDFPTVAALNATSWRDFWSSGGAIDFSMCTDPRAPELERRVVLSQYLTRIQCAGAFPPQETGLTMNSWYGKFHLEMHWWHEVHFALWNRIDLLEKSMDWYNRILAKAEHTASWQGYRGARWPKMTSLSGNESPSSVGAFLIWQEPHPIYYAELLYRRRPEEALRKYQDIVFETADFMASYAQLSPVDHKYHLCHPLIPAQEIFAPSETDDPPFELAYWYYGLTVAQKWRTRTGLTPREKWQDVIDNLAPLTIKEGKYLPTAGAVNAYTDDSFRRDHPVVVGAYGILPLSDKIDPKVMSNTFDEIMSQWSWETTWGWDYPMLAMTAARLGKPAKAIDALLMNVQKNTYLVNGHNYQNSRLRLYLPGNGGLLSAVAMMAAGWDGSTGDSPGFPKDGHWDVRWEDLQRMP
jgi:hypothetical protein